MEKIRCKKLSRMRRGNFNGSNFFNRKRWFANSDFVARPGGPWLSPVTVPSSPVTTERGRSLTRVEQCAAIGRRMRRDRRGGVTEHPLKVPVSLAMPSVFSPSLSLYPTLFESYTFLYLSLAVFIVYCEFNLTFLRHRTSLEFSWKKSNIAQVWINLDLEF